MGFLFLDLLILRSCKGQWQELVTYKQRSSVVVSSICSSWVCRFVVTVYSMLYACLSSTLITLSSDLPFVVLFLSTQLSAPCPLSNVQTSWIESLNWCLMVPLCATVMLRNPHLVSNPPPKAPILHWSCSVCTLARYYVCLLCASLPQQTLAKSWFTLWRENQIKWLNLKPFPVEIQYGYIIIFYWY